MLPYDGIKLKYYLIQITHLAVLSGYIFNLGGLVLSYDLEQRLLIPHKNSAELTRALRNTSLRGYSMAKFSSVKVRLRSSRILTNGDEYGEAHMNGFRMGSVRFYQGSEAF